MIALRRGKFRAFLPKPTFPASDVERYYEHSFVSSQDGETCVEIAVGPKDDISRPDIEIAGGCDDPYIPGNPGIFIVWIKPGSEAYSCLRPGCQITKIGDEDVANVSRHHADNLLRLADQYVEILVITRPLDEVSSNSKLVSWGGESFDVDTETYSDSGRGTEILEREQKPILDGEKINVKVPVGMKGELLPLGFEIQGGRDERLIDGVTGIVIKEIEEDSLLHKNDIKVGDHILKVNGYDVTNVPQHVFFNLLRAADKVAKIQIMKIPVSKDDTEVRVYEDKNTAENEIIVEISTGPKGRLGKLGLKINGGRERPVVPGDPGIFITTVKRGSLLHKVIGPGDKILKIDGNNMNNVTLRYALDRIRAADRRVKLHIRKADHSENDTSERDRKRRAWRAARAFSEEQLEEFKIAFSVFDRTGSGKISLKQVMELCRSLGYNLTATDKDVIVTEFRLGGVTKISFLDFVQIISRIASSKRSETDLTHAFEVFDREEKGFFKLYELEQALKSMHGAQDLGESELADILALADPNGDGHVNLEEFKDLVLPLFHQY